MVVQKPGPTRECASVPRDTVRNGIATTSTYKSPRFFLRGMASVDGGANLHRLARVMIAVGLLVGGLAGPAEAQISTYECQDGLDNDGDGRTDFPNDAECSSPTSTEALPYTDAGCTVSSSASINYFAPPQCLVHNCYVGQTLYVSARQEPLPSPTNAREVIATFSCGSQLEICHELSTTFNCGGAMVCVGVMTCTNREVADEVLLSSKYYDVGVCRVYSAYTTATCWTSFYHECTDGIDNDHDGNFDYYGDPECEGDPYHHRNESDALPECMDGGTNEDYPEWDGRADFLYDADCKTPLDDSETRDDPTPCNDGVDNDGDGYTDYPNDVGCLLGETEEDPIFPSSTSPCANGIDDDWDGIIDGPGDPGCILSGGESEDETYIVSRTECMDLADNDQDYLINYPLDPDCESPDDDSEGRGTGLPQCSDGSDNDGNVLIDYPHDPGCSSPDDDQERTPPEESCTVRNGKCYVRCYKQQYAAVSLEMDGDGVVGMGSLSCGYYAQASCESEAACEAVSAGQTTSDPWGWGTCTSNHPSAAVTCKAVNNPACIGDQASMVKFKPGLEVVTDPDDPSVTINPRLQLYLECVVPAV